MRRLYDIVQVDPSAQEKPEQMGSKAKGWYRLPDGELWLFKRSRDGTGEDWAEKIAAELASILGLPHAVVELAVSEGERGSVSRDFASEAALIHGNELLRAVDPSYPKEQVWGVTAHTVESVLRVLSMPFIGPPDRSPASGMKATEVFIGYLLLDAMIGNSDRHHENWGLLRHGDRVVLAPTYDHASSLGRELQDERRRALLKGGVEKYISKARSALYEGAQDKRPLSPRAAFWAASAGFPAAREAWLARAAGVTAAILRQIIESVHTERMSLDAQEFALALVLQNQRVLCGGSRSP